MYCKHCGKVIADDSKFCRYCGTYLLGADNEYSSTDSEIKKEQTITDEEIIEETINTINDAPCINEESTYVEETSKNSPIADNKLMKILGIASGVLIWGIFGILGLGLLVGFLFVLYMVIMMMIPNGLGITIYLIILGITIYFTVKLIINIIKSFRK